MSCRALVVNPKDNVAVALENIRAGERVEFADLETSRPVVASDNIPFGHKVAIRNIAVGEAVIKYGERIGVAAADIPAGRHVHVHNLRGALSGEGHEPDE